MGRYFAGLALGLALIMPIGAQNVFIVNQGLMAGIPRALMAVTVLGMCDSWWGGGAWRACWNAAR